MNFKEQLLEALEELDVTPRTVAENLSHVIKGETIKERFVKDKNGELDLKSRSTVRTPTDMMRGAMIYDALRGGDLGIAPRALSTTTKGDVTTTVHKRLAVDNRIIANTPEALGMEDIGLGDLLED